MPLVAQRKEELPQCNIPQLEARFQRCPDDVRYINCKYMFLIILPIMRKTVCVPYRKMFSFKVLSVTHCQAEFICKNVLDHC